MKQIKHIVSFLLLLILQLGYAKSFAGFNTNEELCVSEIELSEKSKSDFSKHCLRKKNIFKFSFHENISFRSISFCDGYAELVEAWEVLHKAVRTGGTNPAKALTRNVDAIEALQNLRTNSKLANKSPGKTTSEIDELLANMKGWGDGKTGASYKQVCDKVNELINELPDNVTNLDKFLGSSGFGNANAYTNRHAYVQLERILQADNKAFLKAADEIIFENPLAESNFATQSANSLSRVTSVSDYKVILNPEKIATLSNADKLSVVNAWKNHPGGIFSNDDILGLFENYWDDISVITGPDHLENLLKTRNDWFDDIFKTNFK